jgi:hypothetical protein
VCVGGGGGRALLGALPAAGRAGQEGNCRWGRLPSRPARGAPRALTNPHPHARPPPCPPSKHPPPPPPTGQHLRAQPLVPLVQKGGPTAAGALPARVAALDLQGLCRRVRAARRLHGGRELPARDPRAGGNFSGAPRRGRSGGAGAVLAAPLVAAACPCLAPADCQTTQRAPLSPFPLDPIPHPHPHPHPAPHPQILKLASINLCPNVSGQICCTLMMTPPEPGEPSHELVRRGAAGAASGRCLAPNGCDGTAGLAPA